MPFQAIEQFLASDVATPFFLVVGDAEYVHFQTEFKKRNFNVLSISDFCESADKIPNFDTLINRLQELSAQKKKVVVIGLGEYLALQGEKFALSKLKSLQNRSFDGGKIVLLLRGVADQVQLMQKNDRRFDARRCFIDEETLSDVVVERLAPDIVPITKQEVVNGLKELLRSLEGGRHEAAVQTQFSFEDSLYSTRYIDDVYKVVADAINGFKVPKDCGPAKYWRQLAKDLGKVNTNFDSVLRQHGIDKGIETDLKRDRFNDNYESWLCFIALKYYGSTLQNPYLRRVVDKTVSFRDFKKNILGEIISVPHTSEEYRLLYDRRKSILQSFDDSDLESFISNNRRDLKESVYRLTDMTFAEKREIIEWVGRNGLIPELSFIYPDLFNYLQCYSFNAPPLSGLLTDYFEEYKLQKVKNVVEPTFIKRVEEIARERSYNRLPARDEMIDFLTKQGQKTPGKIKLFWLDALGVEYMSAMSAICRNNDLSIVTKIARASLPTITSENRSFYDNWNGDKSQSSKLDDIKHKRDVQLIHQKDEGPSYLAQELEIVNKFISTIARELHNGKISQAILASDHGASRLAVIADVEEKYETPEDSRGKFSGRCCKATGDSKETLEFATEENGWIVLANYGRFKGSRKADVEVHGGATLEEVVVPVCLISLRNPNEKIELTSPEVVVSFRNPAQITLYSHVDLSNVRIVLIREGKRNESYDANPVEDDRHFKVQLDDVKRAGTYKIMVYSNDDFLGEFSFVAHSGSAKINKSFDDDLDL